MKLTRVGLSAVDLEKLRPDVGDSEWLYARPGVEHYQLLAYLSTLFEGRTIFDIGTHLGDSAIALSYNEKNRVLSFDVVANVPAHRRKRSNVTFHQADLFDPATRAPWKADILGSALIFIDIDPHEGAREYELISWLRTNAYQGIIVLDDIWYFKPMRDRLWSRIEDRYKIDVTHIGHWSGTGIVAFNAELACEGAYRAADTTNWTLVTGYFDLTQMADATPEIKARPPSHYLDQHAQGTLGLEQNLIVYCDPDRVEQIWSLRPRHLHDRTRVIAQEFNAFPLTRHRDRILANRGGGGCPSDPRNTASYYLFCMARYAMLKNSIQESAFGSTHFAWVNICIERMGFLNLAHMQEALGQQRDKFSTCYIDYVDKQTTQSLPDNFGPRCTGRCTMCSGFFTGDAAHMQAVCDRVEQQFMKCLEQGYGHSDEQLINLAYFEASDLFDWYVGDYQEMVTNYARVYQRPERPLRQLITNSYTAKDWGVCAKACDILWRSHHEGACQLGDEDLIAFAKMRAVALAENGSPAVKALDLDALLNAHACDKQSQNGYAPIYHALFKHLRSQPVALLEIGIGTVIQGAYCSMYGHDLPGYRPGASLRAWRDYFPAGAVHGIDVQPDTMILDESRIITALCDSTNTEAVTAYLKTVPAFDIVIDDGAHIPQLQLKTLRNFYPGLKPNGLYVIEDVNRVDPNQERILVDRKAEFESIIGDAMYFTVSLPKADVIVISRRG